MLLVLLVANFVASFEISSVILVTPSVYIDPALPYPFNGTLSSLGLRQSYLIGRELHQNYFAIVKPEGLRVYTDSSAIKSQTALSILQGFFIAGTGDLVPEKLREKSNSPIKGEDFKVFTKAIRDGTAIYHKKTWPVHSVFDEKDYLFNADKTCPEIYGKFTQESIDCKKHEKECKEVKAFCEREIIKTQDLCQCLDLYESAAINKLRLRNNPSKETIDFLKATCVQHYEKNLLDNIQKLMTEKLLDEFKNDLKDKQKLSLYIISELQMKALLLALTREYPKQLPKYGSTIILERNFQAPDNEIILTLNKEKLKIEGDYSINYNKFVNLIDNRRFSNYIDMCNSSSSGNNHLLIILIVVGIVIAAGLGVGGFFLFRCWRKRRAAGAVDGVDDSPAINESQIDPIEGRDDGESDAFLSIMSRLDSLKEKKKRREEAESKEEEAGEHRAINSSVLEKDDLN